MKMIQNAERITLSTARGAARERMARYVSLLTLFASFRSRGPGTDDLGRDDFEWESFGFTAEFSELKDAGYVKGEIGRVITHPHFPTDTMTVSSPGITASGIMQLAELSEYLSRTSISGMIARALLRVGWVVVGVLLSALARLF